MDLLKAEIARKKKAREAAAAAVAVTVTVTVDSRRSSGGGSSRRGGDDGDDGDGRRSRSSAEVEKDKQDKDQKKKRYLKASDLRRAQTREEEVQREREARRAEGGGGDGDGDRREKKRRRTGAEGAEGAGGGGLSDAQFRTASEESVAAATSPGRNKSGGGGKEDEEGDQGAAAATTTTTQQEQSIEWVDAQQQRRKELSALSPAEVTAKLRGLALPVRLFGERTVKEPGANSNRSDSGSGSCSDGGTGYDDTDRIDRLHEALERKRIEMAGLSEMDEFRLGSGHGIRNPFLEKDRGGALASGSAAAAAAVKTNGDAESPKKGGKGSNVKTGDGDHRKVGSGKNTEDDGVGDCDGDDPHKKIHRFFKSLLREWEDDLAVRPDSVKNTAAGRNETKTFKQCKDYIRPLFKMCKTRRLEPGMMAHILNIVKYCEQGEFVKANDAYIDVAIGRAAWPIGVTMVGIHARSGREKIGSSNVAHVMNNELQRKYLTSVKRLMSYCQKKRIDVDPSKKVAM